MEQTTRRQFVTGAVAATAATALAGTAAGAVAGEAAQEDEAYSEPRPEQGEGFPRRAGTVRPGAAPIPPLEVPAAWDEEADVVVVGTGFAGLTASLRCLQGGLSVITVEKEPVTGGAARHACANMCCPGGAKLQREVGYSWIVDDFDPENIEQVKDIAAEFMAHYQYSVDPGLMMREVAEGPKWFDWLDEQDGIDLYPRATNPVVILDTQHQGKGFNNVMGNDNICNNLTADIEAAGGKIELKTACSGLVMQDGAVVGIQVEGERYIKANQAVVLAAGGFGMNLDMLEAFIPTGYMFAASGGPLLSHTGEVTRMGIGAGADIAGWNSFDCWDGALDQYWGDGDGNYWHYMWKTTGIIGTAPFMSIDKMGNRLPFYIGNGTRAAQPRFEGQPFGGGGEAIVTQYMSAPGHRKYLIWDDAFNMETFEQWAGTGYEYLAPKTYVWGALSEVAKNYLPESWESEYYDAIESGAIKKADTIEELEQLCGFEPGVMQKAVERWNACCEAGQDDCIVPLNPDLLVPITTPPFYCGCYGTQIGKTNCGLRVTSKMEVVDTDQRIIPGLYAAWSTAGGFVGENMFLNFGNTSPMGSCGLSGASGFIAAKAILGELEDY